MIHTTAIVHENAQVHDSAEIGPYAIIDEHAPSNSNTTTSHALDGRSEA